MNHFSHRASADLQRFLEQFFMRLVRPCHIPADNPRGSKPVLIHGDLNILRAIVSHYIDWQRTCFKKFLDVIKNRGFRPQLIAKPMKFFFIVF